MFVHLIIWSDNRSVKQSSHGSINAAINTHIAQRSTRLSITCTVVHCAHHQPVCLPFCTSCLPTKAQDPLQMLQTAASSRTPLALALEPSLNPHACQSRAGTKRMERFHHPCRPCRSPAPNVNEERGWAHQKESLVSNETQAQSGRLPHS